MRALSVDFIAGWKVTFVNLSLVITATLTGGHCRGHEVVPNIVVVVVVCLLLGLSVLRLLLSLKKFSFEAHGWVYRVSSVFLKDERGLLQMFQRKKSLSLII